MKRYIKQRKLEVAQQYNKEVFVVGARARASTYDLATFVHARSFIRVSQCGRNDYERFFDDAREERTDIYSADFRKKSQESASHQS